MRSQVLTTLGISRTPDSSGKRQYRRLAAQRFLCAASPSLPSVRSLPHPAPGRAVPASAGFIPGCASGSRHGLGDSALRTRARPPRQWGRCPQISPVTLRYRSPQEQAEQLLLQTRPTVLNNKLGCSAMVPKIPVSSRLSPRLLDALLELAALQSPVVSIVVICETLQHLIEAILDVRPHGGVRDQRITAAQSLG